MFFLRKSNVKALPVAMSGVRMGERVLQIEIDEPSIAGAIAAGAGLSGHAAMAVRDDASAAKARRAAETAGALIDLHVAPPHALPFAGESFDVVIVNTLSGWLAALDNQSRLAALREGHRVLRGGGRLLVIETGERQGLSAWLRPQRTSESYARAGGAAGALAAAGFRASRVLADREGYRFIEGLKR